MKNYEVIVENAVVTVDTIYQMIADERDGNERA